MALFSDRIRQIGTENAFKIGPYINEVAATGLKVIRCNLGEPDFPLPAHGRDEVKRQLDADMTHYVDPQGPAGVARGHRRRDGRAPRARHHAGPGRGVPGRQAANRLQPGDLLQPG